MGEREKQPFQLSFQRFAEDRFLGIARHVGWRPHPGNPWRRLVLPNRIGNWSLTSLQQRLVKTGGRLVKHARYYWLMLAESHLTRRLFGSMVRRIGTATG
jgi:hypothetical protein